MSKEKLLSCEKRRNMKKTFLTIIIFLTACAMAHAQQESRHALEITTGPKSLAAELAFPSHDKVDPGVVSVKEYYQPVLSIGWTYAWKERWEMSLMASATMTWYDTKAYPLVKLPDGSSEIDTEGELYVTRDFTVVPAISVDFRYKWLDRRNVEMYSGIGLGVSLVLPLPYIYIAPIGIKAGGGRVYGIAELNFSPHNTFAMAGIGVRLGNGKLSQSEWRRRQAVIR